MMRPEADSVTGSCAMDGCGNKIWAVIYEPKNKEKSHSWKRVRTVLQGPVNERFYSV